MMIQGLGDLEELISSSTRSLSLGSSSSSEGRSSARLSSGEQLVGVIIRRTPLLPSDFFFISKQNIVKFDCMNSTIGAFYNGLLSCPEFDILAKNLIKRKLCLSLNLGSKTYYLTVLSTQKCDCSIYIATLYLAQEPTSSNSQFDDRFEFKDSWQWEKKQI